MRFPLQYKRMAQILEALYGQTDHCGESQHLLDFAVGCSEVLKKYIANKLITSYLVCPKIATIFGGGE